MQERDRTLALHAEQRHTLTTLSAEIAHELKNPLASIKGLSALVAKDVNGKTAERVTVLRREVDRMQSILEEFLNFSRPLVPLALAETDLAHLAHDVARLHEGTSGERGVEIRVDSTHPVELTCDARKVRQNPDQPRAERAGREPAERGGIGARRGERGGRAGRGPRPWRGRGSGGTRADSSRPV